MRVKPNRRPRRRRPAFPAPVVTVDTVNGHPLRDYRRLLRRGQTPGRLDQATGTVDGHRAVWARDPWNRHCTCPAAPEGCRCPELLGAAARAATATARAARDARDRASQPRPFQPPAVLPPWWLLALLALAVVVAASVAR